MTIPTLPQFPVNDHTLTLIEEAIGTRIGEKDEDGNYTLVGGDFTLSRLLNFLSGYDPTQVVPLDDDGQVVEYIGGLIYHRDDVIRALVAEVRRLRAS